MRIGIGMEAAGTAGFRFRIGRNYHQCHIVAYTDRSLYAIDVLIILTVQAVALTLASAMLAEALGIQAGNGRHQQPYIIRISNLPWNQYPGLAVAWMLIKILVIMPPVDSLKLSYRSMAGWGHNLASWLNHGPKPARLTAASAA